MHALLLHIFLFAVSLVSPSYGSSISNDNDRSNSIEVASIEALVDSIMQKQLNKYDKKIAALEEELAVCKQNAGRLEIMEGKMENKIDRNESKWYQIIRLMYLT